MNKSLGMPRFKRYSYLRATCVILSVVRRNYAEIDGDSIVDLVEDNRLLDLSSPWPSFSVNVHSISAFLKLNAG